jgi:serine/threonine-protein kinase
MDRRTFGDYRIEGIVGAGRMGVVYRATDDSGRSVALKVLRDDMAAIDPVYRERFKREGQLLASLDHPHVIPIHGTGEIDGSLYIATQLTESTLRDAIIAGPIAIDDAMTILAAVAGALDAAHATGVIHRDIKPANVLMDPGPRVYLTDFGLARDPSGIALTVPGQVLGTIDYMAPELLEGVRIGPATDIYALACLGVETLTGTVPYPRDNDAAITYAHVMDAAPSVSERRAELPAALDDVIAFGMAKKADERPASAGMLVEEMRRALDRPQRAPLVATG